MLGSFRGGAVPQRLPSHPRPARRRGDRRALVSRVASVGSRVRVASPAPRFIGQKTPLTVVLQAARGNVANAEIRAVQDGKSSVVGRAERSARPTGRGRRHRRAGGPGAPRGPAPRSRCGRATTSGGPRRCGDSAMATFPGHGGSHATQARDPRRHDATSPRAAPGSWRSARAMRSAQTVSVGAGGGSRASLGPAEHGARVALIRALPGTSPRRRRSRSPPSDEAGNAATRGCPAEIRPRKFPKRHDRESSDAFLQAKVPELLPQRPPASPSSTHSS